MTDKTETAGPARSLPRDVGEALRFLTRLPLPPIRGASHASAIARSVWAFPLVGALIGAVGAAVLIVAGLLNLNPVVSASLAVGAAIALTGGLHEDGLADTFDGLGGATVARKLEIMRDSRIGTHGAAALIVVLMIRVGALSALAEFPLVAMAALIAGEVVSRAFIAVQWHVMPPATAGGLSVEAGTPTRMVTGGAVIVGCVAIAAAGRIMPLPALLTGTGLAALAVFTMSMLNMRTLGGRTGDTLGAGQQVVLAAFVAGASVI